MRQFNGCWVRFQIMIKPNPLHLSLIFYSKVENLLTNKANKESLLLICWFTKWNLRNRRKEYPYLEKAWYLHTYFSKQFKIPDLVLFMNHLGNILTSCSIKKHNMRSIVLLIIPDYHLKKIHGSVWFYFDYITFDLVCLFFVWVFVPLGNFSLIWRHHHYRWRVQILIYALQSLSLSSKGSLMCHTYCEKG